VSGVWTGGEKVIFGLLIFRNGSKWSARVLILVLRQQ
jgi:hypothetical protein